SIPPAVAAQLTALISEYADVFEPFNTLPPQRPVGHTIPLQPGCKPPALPSYKMSQPELLEMKKQVAAFLEQGIIEPSSSPYAAPVLFVKKKSGELRMCIDYRQLNKITLRDQYPLPRVDDLFDRLAGCTVFSSLDLQAGYHQIRIPDEDVPKTAFRTPTGLYQFKVLCFGLTNAPATFQRVMNNAFADVINGCALVYIDDILIMSKSVPEHFNHLRRVLELLRKHQFKAKLSKCEFLKTALKFLGHIVSDQGIAVDPDKVKSITSWPVPRSLTAMQQFLGAANFCAQICSQFQCYFSTTH
ncbi:reverse transcriptase family protein, partial [Rhizobium oryzihabitans]|uniref:reverse transcriptase family protein n=1 Tax=Rhizobium oryzihabitans TaxID=2267833 RepID=UPI0040356E27